MVDHVAAPVLIRAPRPRDHVIDRLIAERAPRLASSAAWPLLRPLLHGLLSYGKARAMADAITPLGGRQALDFVAALLSVKVAARGIEHVPRAGRFVAVCNHPTGIADGLAVYDALRAVRTDLSFYANADAQRVAPRFDEVLIPVEWRPERRTRHGARVALARTREIMAAEGALVVFPAGRLARRTGGVLRDPDWAASAFSVARKFAAPILPLRLTGPPSTLFHFFDRFSGELRDITLFHELLNKRGKRFDLTIGRAVSPAALPADPGVAAAAMRVFVERTLAADPEAVFA